MKTMKFYWWACVLLLGYSTVQVKAITTFIGAEIRYSPVDGAPRTYTTEVDVYTKLSAWDLNEINIDYGDGILGTIPRSLIQDFADRDIRLSTYQANHTYPTNGSYVVRFADYNRSQYVNNIPNAIAQIACISALIVIDPSLGTNHSIAFDTLQFNTRRNWNTLIHTPAPYDLDGDSFVFELVAPWGLGCSPVSGYSLPPSSNFLWLDPENGELLWDYPTVIGDWNLAIRGSEYRNGQLIGQVTRDMNITVLPFEVGLAETTSSAAFPIRPTIATDQLWIDAPGPWTVEVLDASGRAVIHGMQAGNGSPLDLNGINAGTYLLRAVGTDGTRRTARFVKTR